jgi:alpha-tubulin suppressor-like RCC1 family protein
LLLLLCFGIQGCFFERPGSADLQADHQSVSGKNLAQVKLVIKDSKSLQAALRGQTAASALFELKLVNYGNAASPFTLMRKRAEIANNQATVTFTSVPVVSTIASLKLEGANIGGQSEFHGGIDLKPGENTIVLVASGSAEPEDVKANAALLAAGDYATMTRISAALFANLEVVFQGLSSTDQQSAQALFAAYATRISNSNISGLSAGENHSLVLRNDGTFAAFGGNTYGQLGMEGATNQTERKFVPFHKIVSQLAAGTDFSLVLDDSGIVYAAGNNDAGQLGITGISLSAYPVEISGLSSISKVGANYANGFAVDAAGNLYAWGRNTDGQLVTGTTSEFELPRQIANNVDQAVAGSNFILILKKDGTVWGAGNNQFAQMAADIGDQSLSLVQIPGLADITGLAAGTLHCLALKSDGTVYAWGSNLNGQTGLATTTQVIETPTLIAGLSGISRIYAGNLHSIARSSSGVLYGFGDSSKGQLGSFSSSSSPVQLANPTSVTLNSASGNHNLAFSTSVYAWGANDAGQLGNGLISVDGVAVPTERAITW